MIGSGLRLSIKETKIKDRLVNGYCITLLCNQDLDIRSKLGISNPLLRQLIRLLTIALAFDLILCFQVCKPKNDYGPLQVPVRGKFSGCRDLGDHSVH
jgi:hypothetical protein